MYQENPYSETVNPGSDTRPKGLEALVVNPWKLVGSTQEVGGCIGGRSRLFGSSSLGCGVQAFGCRNKGCGDHVVLGSGFPAPC